jgi:hypothetical protein
MVKAPPEIAAADTSDPLHLVAVHAKQIDHSDGQRSRDRELVHVAPRHPAGGKTASDHPDQMQHKGKVGKQQPDPARRFRLRSTR